MKKLRNSLTLPILALTVGGMFTFGVVSLVRELDGLVERASGHEWTDFSARPQGR